MFLHQASLDRIIRLGDVEDESNLIASELEQVIEDVSECVGTLDTDVIKVCESVPERTIGHESDWS